MGWFSKPKAPKIRTPVEDPNSLRSRAFGRVLDAVAEGPCVGLVNGLKSVYFDGTPIENDDGTHNFANFDIQVRTGTPDQDYVADFPAVESEISVGTIVKKALPVTRRVDNLSADAVRITVTTPSLVYQDIKTGDAKGTGVDFYIRIRRAGRTQWDFETFQSIVGKQTGEYQRAFRLPLTGDGPWDVQIERVTADSDTATLQNTIQWTSYTEIIDHKLTYPNTAYIASKFDAEQFDSVPKREFDWKGWIIKVPSNYDPAARFYNGLWDGTWRMAWSDNPAWLFYALLTHPRGAGLPESSVDRWSLYQVARYCDEFVDDGYGGKEPRFTANFVINTREEAFAVINTLASAFRGMAYWSSGAVSVVADMPTDPSVIVTPSNTIGGFSYSGGANKARATACAAAFLDKDRNYERSIEIYEDVDAIEKWGYNLKELTAFACTSRGQAMRLAKWTVDTEVHSGDSLTYKASIDHLNVVPGSVVQVHDPAILGFRAGGRLAGTAQNGLALDDAVTLQPGIEYRIKVVMPDLSLAERVITNAPGTTANLTLKDPLPAIPIVGAEWILLSSAVTTGRQFRVIGVTEDDGLEFTITAIEHDPFKYDRVEKGVVFQRPPFSTIPNPGIVSPPSNVRVERQYISTGTGWTTALEVSWDASPDAYVSAYRISYRRDNGNFITLPETSSNTVTIYGETAGHFTIHVQALNYAGVISRPAVLDIDILDNSPITMIRPTGLELEGQGNNTVFSGRDPKFVWRPTALRGAYPLGEEPAAGAGYLDHIFRDYEIRIYDTGGRLIHTDHTGLTWWTFSFEKNVATANGPHRAFKVQVFMRDKWGNVSLPAELSVANPAPPQPVNLAILPGVGTIFVTHDKPADLDFAGDLIWMSETQGFEPSLTNQVYDGPSTYNVVQAPESSTRYLRVASYDVFGKTGLNISPEFRVLIGGVKEPDFQPPTVPKGLTLSQRSSTAPDGTVTYWLKADWTSNPESDLLLYTVAIKQDGGNYVYFAAAQPGWETVVQAGSTYTVQLRAVDNLSNASLYSVEESIMITAQNAAPPAVPTALKVTSTLRTLWLQWPEHPARDWSHMEIWESETNDRSTALHLHNAGGTTFPRQGLAANQTRYYWIKAVSRSLAKSDFFPVSATGGIEGKTGQLDEADFPNGIIKEDFFDVISATKIKAGTALAETITVNGNTLGGIALGNADPAARINQAETKIDPGKITISGETTLAHWRGQSDQTTINGGVISANSIRAESLIIGSRNLDFIGISFTPDAKTNILSWTSGTIHYPDDQGNIVAETISAGGVQWTPPGIPPFNGLALYIMWSRGWGALGVSTDTASIADQNQVHIGTYQGGSSFLAHFGRTIIDGNSIQTNSINADRIQANTITAKQLSADKLITNSAQIGSTVINSAHIADGQILGGHIKSMTFDKLTDGLLGPSFLQIGGVFGQPGGNISIEGRFGYHAIRYNDTNNVSRVEIGQNRPTPNPELDGLIVRDMNGKELLKANGFGIEIAGTDQIVGGAVTQTAYSNDGGMLPWFVHGAPITPTNPQGLTDTSIQAVARFGQGTTISNPDGADFLVPGTTMVRLLLDGTPINPIAITGWGSFAIPLNFVISWPRSTSHTIRVQAGSAAGTNWADLSTSTILVHELRR